MDDFHKKWLKLIDNYVVPFINKQIIKFLRSKEGMCIIIGIPYIANSLVTPCEKTSPNRFIRITYCWV